MLKFLREECDPPCPWDRHTCRLGARDRGERGTAILKYARTADPPCEWDESTCLAAASHGNIASLKWARTEADPVCPWDERTCAGAAGGDKSGDVDYVSEEKLIETLTWLRTEADPPAPWNEDTCYYAVKTQHWQVLRWLRTTADPPCPWYSNTKEAAEEHFGKAEVESWPTHPDDDTKVRYDSDDD